MERKDEGSLKNLVSSMTKTQQSKLAMWSIPKENEFVDPAKDTMKEIEEFVMKHRIPIGNHFSLV